MIVHIELSFYINIFVDHICLTEEKTEKNNII